MGRVSLVGVTASLHASAIGLRRARVMLVGLVEAVECSTGRTDQRADARPLAGAASPARNRSTGGSEARPECASDQRVTQRLLRLVSRRGTRVVVTRLDVCR